MEKTNKQFPTPQMTPVSEGDEVRFQLPGRVDPDVRSATVAEFARLLNGKEPFDAIPVVSVDSGPFTPKVIVPDSFIQVYYDPIRCILADPSAGEYLTDPVTESSGSADSDPLPAAASIYQFRAFALELAPDSDEGTQKDALATITQHIWHKNAHMIGATETAGTTAGVATADTNQTIRFDMGAKEEALAYIHLVHRPTSLGRVLPAVALAANDPASNPLAAVMQPKVAFTGLSSGSKLQVNMVPLVAGTQQFDRYARHMIERYYR